MLHKGDFVMDKATLVLELDEMRSDVAGWTKLKNSTINNKDAATLLGDNPWRSKDEILAEKKGFVTFSPEKDSEEAKQMQAKIEQQCKIKDKFMDKTGFEVIEGGVYRSNENNNFIATIRFKTNLDEPVMITSVNSKNVRYWEDTIPAHISDEAQWNMMVTGAKKCYIGCLIDDKTKDFSKQDIKIVEVKENYEIMNRLKASAEKFLNRMNKEFLNIPLNASLFKPHPTQADSFMLTLPKGNKFLLDEIRISDKFVGPERTYNNKKIRYLNLPVYNYKGESFMIGKGLTSAQVFCAVCNIKGRELESNNRHKKLRVSQHSLIRPVDGKSTGAER